MPPCSPEAATSPLRSSVTALAATAFIGGSVHSPHGTERCKPPRRARRRAAGPPQRLERGEAQNPLPHLSGRAEPAFGARRGAWPAASGDAVRPQPLRRRRARPTGGSRRRREDSPQLTQPALTSLLRLWSEKPLSRRRRCGAQMGVCAAAAWRRHHDGRSLGRGGELHREGMFLILSSGTGLHVPRSCRTHLGFTRIPRR